MWINVGPCSVHSAGTHHHNWTSPPMAGGFPTYHPWPSSESPLLPRCLGNIMWSRSSPKPIAGDISWLCCKKSRRNARPPGAFLHHIHSPHPGRCGTSVAPRPDAPSVTPVGDCSAPCPALHLPCRAFKYRLALLTTGLPRLADRRRQLCHDFATSAMEFAGLPSLVSMTQTGLSWPRTPKQWLPFHSKEHDALSE